MDHDDAPAAQLVQPVEHRRPRPGVDVPEHHCGAHLAWRCALGEPSGPLRATWYVDRAVGALPHLVQLARDAEGRDLDPDRCGHGCRTSG
jgi:hypothetical protein